MTREEAISILKERLSCTTYVDSEYVDCVNIEAIELAIEALRNIGKIEYLVNTYKQEGRAPNRTITMEQLADILGIEQKERGEAE